MASDPTRQQFFRRGQRLGGHLLRARCLTEARQPDSRARSQRAHGDDGAVIILALVFLVAVSLIVTGLLTWVGASLHATTNFSSERNNEYNTTAAVNLAIQNTRYTFDAGASLNGGHTTDAFLNNPSPVPCAQYPTSPAPTVDVYCSMVWQPYSANTRVFTYSACQVNDIANNSPADCAADPMLQAVVAFYDYSASNSSISNSPPQCVSILQINGHGGNGSCGETMTQVSWQWNPIVPAVTSLSPATGAMTGGTTVNVNGTGFTSGEQVKFTLENPTPGSYDPAVAGTIVTNPTPGCALPTCIQVTSPAISSGFSYYVTVTTPGGTSQTVANDSNPFVPTFTYTAVTPTITGLEGSASGPITGNSPVIIQGTGFLGTPTFPAQVFFCPNTTGTGCISGTVVSITAPSAGSSTYTLDALTPAVTTAAAYYIQVESYNLYSSLTGAPTWTYGVEPPIITSLSPSTGPAGTALVISGANFLSGSTVAFCPVANWNSGSQTCSGQTNATVASQTVTQINVAVPSVAAGQYYPIVSLPSQYNAPTSQPYNEAADIFTVS